MDRRQFFATSSIGAIGLAGNFCAKSGEIPNVPTVANLRQINPSEVNWVVVKGYYAPFDGGGGIFGWVTDFDVNPDDGLTFASRVDSFRPGEDNSGGWHRLHEGTRWNVRWWGAHGDGDRDDAPVLQAALDAARTRSVTNSGLGAEIYIPPGHYSIGSTVRVPSGVTLIGAGMSATRLHVAFDEGAVLQMQPNSGYQQIRKLSIRSAGLRHNVTGIELAGQGAESKGSGNHNIIISDVFILKAGKGIEGKRCWMSRFSNVRIQFAEVGIDFSDGFTTLKLDNCFVSNCIDGIRLIGIDTATLDSCAVDKATRNAFRFANGSFVLNTCHSEASWYATNTSSIVQVEGPATVQVNGYVTYAVGVDQRGKEDTGSKERNLYLFDCRAEEGPVHVTVSGFRQEETGDAKLLRFSSSNSVHTEKSSINLQQCLLEVDKKIEFDTHFDQRPHITSYP